MLLKLGFDANNIANSDDIVLVNIGISVYKYIFIWQVNFARLWHFFLTLSNSMARPMKLR